MEKSKHSEEEIIRLGKKIVEELQLDSSTNTLGRWMSHYIAELIIQVENCENENEKIAIQKDCCETILKLWQCREHIPELTKPLSELEPLIELLDSLKKDDFSFPHWRYFGGASDDSTWAGFIDTVRRSSENIFELCLYSAINSNLLSKKQKWIKEHKDLLSKEEKEMLEHLAYLVNRSKSFIVFTDKKEEIILDELTGKQKYEAIFNKIELEINDILSDFKDLKNSILKEMKDINR